MDIFKVPANLPQDLLLIQDLVGEPTVPTPVAASARTLSLKTEDDEDEDIHSSESEIDSEDEIAADLGKTEDVDVLLPPESPDSDNDSDSDRETAFAVSAKPQVQNICDDGDDEDDSGPTASSTYFQTKNEVTVSDFPFPDIEEIGPEEELEKVGEVMNIMENAVIVKCTSSEVVNRGTDKTLDSGTLLVFEDRKVMGYIYETFGPTSQPLYQVRFGPNFPLDREKIRLSREVFHVPQRSYFVFLSQIKLLKGSDASNMHDEEPAEDELEFSDDEEEAAHKHRRKRRGESRSGSVMSSRHSTPMARDLDMPGGSYFGVNPYDEHGPYDTDFTVSSRPPPIPYDDPYSDAYNAEILISEADKPTSYLSDDSMQSHEISGSQRSPNRKERGRGRGRGYRQGGARQFGARGRGRGRGRRDRGIREDGSVGGELSPTRYSNDDSGWTDQPPAVQPMVEQFGLHQTSQYLNEPTFAPPMTAPNDGWSPQPYHPYPMQPFCVDPQWYQHQYVQPHINPRFASAFGLNVVGVAHSQEYSPVEASGYYEQERYQPHPSDEWTVHVTGAERPGVAEQDSDQ